MDEYTYYASSYDEAKKQELEKLDILISLMTKYNSLINLIKKQGDKMLKILKIFKKPKEPKQDKRYLVGCSGSLYNPSIYSVCDGFIYHKALKQIVEAKKETNFMLINSN
ncbi:MULTISPECIES: hypothetical protein [Campylobacter]|uniref:Uncharacterized protein n=1 Tax=Campylobacter vicugnae TaxID=1660076 RepID=A0ABZ2E7C2_9BACT|nr:MULTISPECIES: hypothetical protein [unclassified Campylobacter]MCR8690592.1 hypothetical protein [Campylobacter sp. RM9264]MCR8701499.1 hypothetical protein [Campylobacter sp. RM12176]